jgi:hypothetical protein
VSSSTINACDMDSIGGKKNFPILPTTPGENCR